MNGLWTRARAWWRVLHLAYNRFFDDDGDALAGYIAYSVFLAVLPFAIFAMALAGALIGPTEGERLMMALFDVAPEHIAQTLSPVILSVTAERSDGLITFSAAIALFFASNAVEALRFAFDRAYEVKTPRGFFARRALAIVYVFIASVAFGLLGFLIIFAPLMLLLAERFFGFTAPFGVTPVRYGVGLVVFALFLFQMNLWLPSKRPQRRWLWPGIFVTVLLWTLGATGFSLYLSYAPSYSLTYGTLAGVIITLLFLYLTGAAIIFGAEVSAVLMALRRDAEPGEAAPKQLRHDPA